MDSIRLYQIDDQHVKCYYHSNGKEKLITGQAKKVFIEIIDKYNLKEDYQEENMCEIYIKSLLDIDKKDFNNFVNSMSTIIDLSHVNRSKSKRIIATTALIGTATLVGLNSFFMNLDKKKVKSNNQSVNLVNDIKSDTFSYSMEDEKLFANTPVYTSTNTYTISDEDKELFANTPVYEEFLFPFKYDDRSSMEQMMNASKYESIFEKYGEMYGIDSKLLMAIAAQENRGIHNVNEERAAIGIMQIEKSIWVNSSLTVYNFDTQENEQIVIDLENLKDVDYNIKVGTMILQDCLKRFNYNVPLSLQAYNMGIGSVQNILLACSNNTGFTYQELLNNPENTEWLNYTYVGRGGDKEYVNHVISFIEDGTQLCFKNLDNHKFNVRIDNLNSDKYVL